jgi:hypothetical protein
LQSFVLTQTALTYSLSRDSSLSTLERYLDRLPCIV